MAIRINFKYRDLVFKPFPRWEINMDAVYVDCAPYRSRFRDRAVSAFYLPMGIKQLDREISERIMNLHNNPDDSAKNIRWTIKNNEHLHRLIKKNLLGNLKRVEREIN